MIQYSKLSEIREHFQVEETGRERMPYIIKGKRGASYGLFRQVSDDGSPKMDGLMFAMKSTGRAWFPRLLGRNEWVKED